MVQTDRGIPGNTPLGCLLKRWKSEGFFQEVSKGKMIDYCNYWWPEYKREGPAWPENGTDLSLMISPDVPVASSPSAVSPPPAISPLPSVSHRSSLYPPLPESSEEEEEEEEEVANMTGVPVNVKRVVVRPPAPSPLSPQNRRNTPLGARTRQGRKNYGEPQLIAPLREAMGPQGEKVLVKVPFSPGDLVIWKQSAGSYRENPERVARVVKMIIKTQNPDWNDMQVLLDTLMDSTEKEMVLRAMKERAQEMIRLHAVGRTVGDLVPSDDPGWDPNRGEGRESIREYQELLVEGIRTGMPKTLNWSKLYSVRQDKNESPSAFLERLKETARRFTDLEIDSEAGKLQLALIFLGQTQEDICKKLQKLEGHDTRDLDKMLEIAWKVYNNRDKEANKRQQASLLAVLQQTNAGRGRGRGGFGRGRGQGRARFQNVGTGGRGMVPPGLQQGGLASNQCAFCRQIGHWKNECPVKAGLGGAPGLGMNNSGGYPMNPEGVAQALVLGNYQNQS
uniref:Core shell protein Gag P30 domain-containing protein n=1 Tax=Ficedula albicollis TaxID=59894 RepID=A0A803WD83_FICAL